MLVVQALHKYKQKRKNLNFTKKIRYESRKQLAQARPRVKGQFVRMTSGGPELTLDSDAQVLLPPLQSRVLLLPWISYLLLCCHCSAVVWDLRSVHRHLSDVQGHICRARWRLC